VIKMGVRNQPVWRPHEIPGLGTEIEAELEFGDAKIRLHCRPRITFDGQSRVLVLQDGGVVDHGNPESWFVVRETCAVKATT